MRNRKNQPDEPLAADAGKSQFAFTVGNAYRMAAEPMLKKLRAGLQEGVENAGADGAGVGVAVTNLGFALEMHLKAVRMLLGLSVPHHHHLGRLYEDLPADAKAVVEEGYQAKISAAPPTSLLTLRVVLSASKDGHPPEAPAFPNIAKQPEDVISLLSQAGSLATTWRYPWEAVPKGETYGNEQTFEHSRLVHLDDVLQETLQETFSKINAPAPHG